MDWNPQPSRVQQDVNPRYPITFPHYEVQRYTILSKVRDKIDRCQVFKGISQTNNVWAL